MGTTCGTRQTHCSFLKCCKWRYFVYNRRRLDQRLLPWQRRNGCHLVPFMMNIDGAKFEEHRFNTTRDMLDSMIYPFLERLMTSLLSSFTYYKILNISITKEDISKRKTPFVFDMGHNRRTGQEETRLRTSRSPDDIVTYHRCSVT